MNSFLRGSVYSQCILPGFLSEMTPDSLRVEVADHDERVPAPKDAVDDWDTSGRGLAFVASMSKAWGVQRLPGGKVVWFEVARPDR